MARFPLGLGFVWLWAFPHLAHSFALFCSLAFLAVPFCYSCCDVICSKPTGPFWVCCSFSSSWLNVVIWPLYYIARGLFCPIYFLLGILDLFAFLGLPWPFCFPWASLAIFSNSAFSWAFINSFGLPWPNYLIIYLWGSWACHQPLTFFTCITSGLLWPILTFLHHILPMDLLLLSLRAPLGTFAFLRPICICYGPMIHYSCHLDLMVFPSTY